MLETFLNFFSNLFSRFRTPAVVTPQVSLPREEKRDEKGSGAREQRAQEFTSLRDLRDQLRIDIESGRIKSFKNIPLIRVDASDRCGVSYSRAHGQQLRSQKDGLIVSGASSEFSTFISKKPKSPSFEKDKDTRPKTIYLGEESDDSCCDIVSAFKSCWACLFGDNETPRKNQAPRKKSSANEDEEYMYMPRRGSN